MPWYIPFTIIPGVALLILSTSNIMLTLNKEISKLKRSKSEDYREIILLKFGQLKKVSYAITLLYLGIFLFFASGVSASLLPEDTHWGRTTLTVGASVVCLALCILIVYAFKAVKIRELHLLGK